MWAGSRYAAIGVLGAVLAGPAMAEECTPGTGETSETLSGEVQHPAAFRAGLKPGWTFTLRPVSDGFDLRIFDAAGTDLTQVTPPFHFVNPRDIYGWHFRNKDNTGPNEGSVNAPQEMRGFYFDPLLTEKGGFDPHTDTWVEPPGRGWIEILDYRLANLEPGQRARMDWLKFEACLIWPAPLRERD